MEHFFSAGKEIDVEKIMEDIRQKIEEKKRAGILKQKDIDEISHMELLPLPDFLDIPNVYEPHLYPEGQSEPFEPFQVDQEIEAGAAKKFMAAFRRLLFPLVRFLIRPITRDMKNLFVEMLNENKREIHRLRPLVLHSKEYIHLMHNALNNMIVESSKLKIEEELLKTRITIMEDRIEFLEKRGRQIEKKLFNQ